MRILFDQGTPVPLRRYLSRHSVDTAFERDWSILQNGELLEVAEQEGYETERPHQAHALARMLLFPDLPDPRLSIHSSKRRIHVRENSPISVHRSP